MWLVPVYSCASAQLYSYGQSWPSRQVFLHHTATPNDATSLRALGCWVRLPLMTIYSSMSTCYHHHHHRRHHALRCKHHMGPLERVPSNFRDREDQVRLVPSNLYDCMLLFWAHHFLNVHCILLFRAWCTSSALHCHVSVYSFCKLSVTVMRLDQACPTAWIRPARHFYSARKDLLILLKSNGQLLL